MKHVSNSLTAISLAAYLGLAGAGLVGVGLAGCSGGPSRVLPPSIDAGAAAEEAMETYDTDGNGYVEGEELEQAPGLKAAMATLDVDKDGKVAENEVAERIRAWSGTNVGVTTIQCSIFMDGRPLAGASVTFEPEDFLGDEIQAATAVTGPMGEFYPMIPKEKRPSESTPAGMQFGLYQIKVSKIENGTEQIPEQYNAKTTLGQEVSNEDPSIQRHSVVFRLTSK